MRKSLNRLTLAVINTAVYCCFASSGLMLFRVFHFLFICETTAQANYCKKKFVNCARWTYRERNCTMMMTLALESFIFIQCLRYSSSEVKISLWWKCIRLKQFSEPPHHKQKNIFVSSVVFLLLFRLFCFFFVCETSAVCTSTRALESFIFIQCLRYFSSEVMSDKNIFVLVYNSCVNLWMTSRAFDCCFVSNCLSLFRVVCVFFICETKTQAS